MSSSFERFSEDSPVQLQAKPFKNQESQIPSSSMKSKIAIILAFVLAVAALAGSVYLYRQLNQEKRQREAAETSQIQLRDKISAHELSLKTSEGEIAKFQKQVKDYEDLKKTFDTKMAAAEKQISELKGQLADAEKKLSQDAMKKAAEKVQEEYELQPVGPPLPDEAGDEAAAAVQGPQVLTINRKFNFVVVNQGLQDGLKAGDSLKVQRDGKQVAVVTIEKIYDNFAAAALSKESKDNPVKEGDSVAKS